MANFVPNQIADEAYHRRLLSTGVNAALRGELAVIGGPVDFASGSTTTTIWDTRLYDGRLINLIPTNASAAACSWYLSAIGAGATGGYATFNYPSLASTASFKYYIIGAKSDSRASGL